MLYIPHFIPCFICCTFIIFHVDEEGTYTTTTEYHVLLVTMTTETGAKHCAIYDYGDTVFVFGIQESDITKYKRISKDPVFINNINE